MTRIGDRAATPPWAEEYLPRGTPRRLIDDVVGVFRREDVLVADALQRLGMPPVRSADAEQVVHLTRVDLEAIAERTTEVRVGAKLSLGGARDAPWTVIGAGRSDRIQLARRDADGALHTTARRWPALLERNPQLLDGPLIDANGLRWEIALPSDLSGVTGATLLRATAETRDPDGRAVRHAADLAWADVILGTELTRRRPVIARPDNAAETVNLRRLVGDRRFVISELPEFADLPSALIATETMPAGAPDEIADLRELGTWMRDLPRLPSWGGSTEFTHLMDGPNDIGNAAAAYVDGTAYLFEGPKDSRTRESLFGGWRAERHLNDVVTSVEVTASEAAHRAADVSVQRHRLAVRGHEATHIAHHQMWARTTTGSARPADLERSIVGEAFGDLLGASIARDPDLGLRRLGQLPAGAANLDEVRRGLRVLGSDADVHLGTQLLTKPMLRAQRTQGWDFVAEVTGAAMRTLELQHVNCVADGISIPAAATALRDATAWRLGATDATVLAMESAWRALGVLR